MKTKESRSPRALLAPLSLCALAAAAATSGGCLTRPIDPLDTRTTFTAHFKQVKSGVDKIDLLLMIDNSSSMADKQAILADAVPTLVKGLLNPPCVGDDGKPVAAQPASPIDACPAGSAREFTPVTDVHIGILSSSIGGHGADACGKETYTCPGGATNSSGNDAGHLVSRNDPCTGGAPASYDGKAFLAWDPKQEAEPHGEKDLESAVSTLRSMVSGVGQIGCGFESQLESWYRFLVDPEPYQSISLDGGGKVVLEGIDQDLLAQRAAFLRPDSLVAVLMLTDENDCSIREELDFPKVASLSKHMARARQECEKNPDDHCCAPCDSAPADCPADAACQAKPALDKVEDPVNLRCFDQKRRFGRDYLYPVERYAEALTLAQVAKRNGEVVDNPLFAPDPTGKVLARTPEMGLVFLAGIVGVPWQDIARQRSDGKPDLEAGLDAKGNPVGGFMSAEELRKPDGDTGVSRWDVILGDPATRKLPLDPLMHETRDVRTGTNPITGDPLAPPDATQAYQNPINGHEWNTYNEVDGSNNPIGDLQYACIFDLKPSDARDCTNKENGCDCTYATTDGANNPLCQDGAGFTKTQKRAKGYPGLRQLSVLKGIGDQGIVASVCPAQVDDATRTNYGYSPAIGAIIGKLKTKLTGQCLTRPLTPDSKGQVACVVIEARPAHGGACCDGDARHDPDAEHAQAVAEAKADPSAKGAECFCEIDQVRTADLPTCQTNLSVVPTNGSAPVDGWCYLDEQLGAPALLDGCSAGEKYKLRFVGGGQPAPDAVTFITCAGGGT